MFKKISGILEKLINLDRSLEGRKEGRKCFIHHIYNHMKSTYILLCFFLYINISFEIFCIYILCFKLIYLCNGPKSFMCRKHPKLEHLCLRPVMWIDFRLTMCRIFNVIKDNFSDNFSDNF